MVLVSSRTIYWAFHPHFTNAVHPGLKYFDVQVLLVYGIRKWEEWKGPQSLGKDPEAAASIKWDYCSLMCAEHKT